MTLISCPFCGKQVSDQASTCEQCGATIKTEETINETPDQSTQALCSKCGNPISSGMSFCPSCGCPIKTESDYEQDNQPEEPAADTTATTAEEPAQHKVKSKTLLIVIAVAVVVIAALIIGFAVNAHQEQVKKEEEAAAAQAQAEQEEADRKAAYNQYIDDLETSMVLMLSGAAEAEKLGNITNNVWHSAIWERSEDGWDEDIRKYYSDDFNEALKKLYSDSDIKQKVKTIKDNQNDVSILDKKLQNPPDGLESAYSAYESMHDTYIKLTNLAISPTGSLQTYSSEFRQADSACLDAYEKFKTRIPDKEE